jgi:hypothetical protein
VSLRFAEERLRGQIDTSGPRASTPDFASAYRGRLIDALRATGKPVEWAFNDRAGSSRSHRGA